MSSATELFDSWKPQADVKGGRDTRRFLVVTDTLDENPLNVPGLPAYYAQHPRNKNIKCDSKSTVTKIAPTETGGMKYIVECVYTNDYSARLTNKPPVRESNYKAWNMSFSRREISIPYFLGEMVQIFQSTQSVEKFIWFQHELKTDDVWNVTVSRKVNVSSWTFTQTKKILDQRGKYHYLDGLPGGNNVLTLAKFLGADPHQIEQDRWEVTYSWLIDSGNNNPNVTGINPIFQPIFPIAKREPFQVYIVEPQTDTTPPRIVPVNSYTTADIDQAGGINLPGNPLT